MKEKDFQVLFGKRNTVTGVFELKLSSKTSLPFDAVKTHQIEGLLLAASNFGLYHKISDSPIFPGMKTRFTAKKPFDCLFIKNQPAYVVICWYIPRKSKEVHYIPVDVFVSEKEKSDRKSLTRQRSSEISSITSDFAQPS